MSEKKISLMIYYLIFYIVRSHFRRLGSYAHALCWLKLGKGFYPSCTRASPATQSCLQASGIGGLVTGLRLQKRTDSPTRKNTCTSTIWATGGTRAAARAGSSS